MTITSIILCIVITLVVLIICVLAAGISFSDGTWMRGVLSIVISIVVIGLTWGGTYWYYSHTESGKRALKTQDSNLNNGIEREVIVYDMDGDELEYFRGRFDVDYEDERIMFDDENGNRHVIYFKSGTVIINEIEGESNEIAN